MITVRNLLQTKGSTVWSITPQTQILDALKLMADKDVGALLVLKGSQLAGIISERDFARMIAQSGMCIVDAPVEAYMTKDVFTIQLDQTIAECMQIMTEKRIRHLPVLDQGELVGLISIGDVVKEIISSHESTIETLEDYIEGRGYGK